MRDRNEGEHGDDPFEFASVVCDKSTTAAIHVVGVKGHPYPAGLWVPKKAIHSNSGIRNEHSKQPGTLTLRRWFVTSERLESAATKHP